METTDDCVKLDELTFGCLIDSVSKVEEEEAPFCGASFIYNERYFLF